MPNNNDMPDEIWVDKKCENIADYTFSDDEKNKHFIRYTRADLTPPQSPNRAVLEALHWIVTNGNFTEEQTNDLTEKMRIVEAAATQADEVKK